MNFPCCYRRDSVLYEQYSTTDNSNDYLESPSASGSSPTSLEMQSFSTPSTNTGKAFRLTIKECLILESLIRQCSEHGIDVTIREANLFAGLSIRYVSHLKEPKPPAFEATDKELDFIIKHME